jgi:membrane protein
VAGALGLVRRSLDSMLETAGTRDAAQLAYFLVMSFPAALLLLVWAFSGLLNDDSVREPIVDAIVDWLPIADPRDQQQVEALLDDVAAGAGGLGFVGVVSLLYSASGAIGATRHAVNEAWGRIESRPFVPAKALDAGLTLAAAPVVIAAAGLSLSGTLADKIGDRPWVHAVAQFGVTRLVPLVLVFLLVAALFRVLPESPRASFRRAWPGALVTVAGIVLIQYGTQVAFQLFGDANAIYGTMGALLAVVFAAYLVALAVVFGAHVSAQAGSPVEESGESEPVGRALVGAVRGLFVRPRQP